MIRVFALATMFFFVSESAAQETIRLSSVGLSVEAGNGWTIRSDRTDESSGEKTGLAYVTRIDSTELTFDLLVAIRYDRESVDDWSVYNVPSGWELVSDDVDLDHLQAFDDVAADLFRVENGVEDKEELISMMYVVRAISGTQAYRIDIGGLANQFDEKGPEYLDMLASMRMVDSD